MGTEWVSKPSDRGGRAPHLHLAVLRVAFEAVRSGADGHPEAPDRRAGDHPGALDREAGDHPEAPDRWGQTAIQTRPIDGADGLSEMPDRRGGRPSGGARSAAPRGLPVP